MSGCVHRLFAAQAGRAPDRVAVVGGEESWSYGRLNAYANRLAHLLLRRGLGPEDRVGLLLERSPELIAGMLAALKAGGCYVPLDPDYPPERVRLLLEDAGFAVLLTRCELLDRLGAAAPQALCIDADGAEIAGQSAREPEAARADDPERLAYLIYTSGSTGMPKGVMVPHRGLANLCRWHLRAFGVTREDRASQLASVGFDASVYEIWPYLVLGATLDLVPPRVRVSPEELGRWLLVRRVTLAYVPTLLVEELLDGRWEASGPAAPALRVVFTGGDFLKRSPAPGLPFALENGYGPTETTVVATSGRAAPGAEGPPPLGRAIDNVRVWLLDDELEAMPADEPGEIHVGGEGVARGYAGRPAPTARAFLPDPFGPPGSRLYRTGDRGRRRPDGALEFLGRLDDQVKIRGQRVEPGEIEAVLVRHPGIGSSAVVAREGDDGSIRLVAYIVPRDGPPPGADELRGWLARTLPSYMVPSAIVVLGELPRTPHGKVDRRALPAPRETSDPASDRSPPRTPVERRIAEIWSGVLGVESIGIDEHFLELGGHSLTATRILATLRRELGIHLPLAALFERPTIRELAREVVSAPTARRGEGHALGPRPSGPIPASYAQEAIWFLHQIEPNLTAYNSQSTLRFQGSLDAAALQRALQEVVRRHEIFRTSFHAVDDSPVQVIHADGPAPLARSDLSSLPREARAEALRELIDMELAAPIDLSRLPLARWHLVHLAPDDSVLIHVEHHFLHDGWSFGIFLHDLKELYEAFVHGRPSRLPELEMQYADFALWQREWVSGPEAEAQIRYWRDTLGNPPPPVLELPTDRPRLQAFSFRGDARRARLAPSAVEAARAFAREARATLYVTCLSAFQALMARYSGQHDFCVGVSMANRQRAEHLSLIGLLVNMMPLRAEVGSDSTFLELARRVQGTMLEAQANQEIPFERLIEAVQPDRTLQYNPLFQASFNFHDSPMPEFSLDGVEFVPTEAYNIGAAKFDLHVIAIPRWEQRADAREDDVTLLWEYSTDLFDTTTIERMGRHYEALLMEACRHPDQALSRLPILLEAERHCVLFDWSAGPEGPETTAGVHRLLEDQALRTPDRVAVTMRAVAFSYGELDRRAGALARHLRSRGLGPEARVGLYLERSPQLPVAVLGVLKAAGTYVPLDPSLPRERLAWMIEDAAVEALLTLGSVPPEMCRREPVIRLDTDWRAIEAADAAAALPEVDPAQLAYVIYTSGSTGRPKGVALPHAALANLVRWAAAGADNFRRQLQLASLSFDASFLELFTAWTSGGTAVLVPEAVRLDFERLARIVDEEGVTAAILPVTVLDLLAREALDRGSGALGGLCTVVSTGEQLKLTSAVRGLLEARPRLRLKNYYGPSETHVVTAHDLAGPSEAWAPNPPIGRPIPATTAYVLDAALEPLLVGLPGQLYLGGAALARGYLGRPGLTAERFVPDPFSIGARLYQTGDRCRWRRGGELDFLGRLDDQVKVRGFRVEPGEIEVALGSHPRVAQASVVVRELPSGEAGLVAYVLPNGGGSGSTPEELRGHLRRHLPEHMIPAAFVFLERMPLGPTGKVDRGALPPPNLTRGAEDARVPPRNSVEEVLVQVWGEVLGRTGMGVRESFFDLGGHSLQAVRVASSLRKIFQVDLPPQTLFESPTIEALGSRLERSLPEPGFAERIALTFLEVQGLAEEELRGRL